MTDDYDNLLSLLVIVGNVFSGAMSADNCFVVRTILFLVRTIVFVVHTIEFVVRTIVFVVCTIGRS